jgi:alkanesulfonate monooxygenase SsuD/methylene tetrahydromethanopterin reductase-like flavin-dependent oxidoreductase (luciferase family)
MKIGLMIGTPATAVVDARQTEQSGFDYVACEEHLFFHGPVPNSLAVLAAAAGATSRVRLVSAVTLLPLYPAALVAKLAATIDIGSGGRFELGVGAGGELPAEFDAAGVDVTTRFRRTEEGLHVIRRLFTGEAVTYRGEFATLTGVALDPPPVQPGGPYIWLGGRGKGALRRAGRHANVWMPYMVDAAGVRRGLEQVRLAATDHGRSPDALSAALFAWIAVDQDADWARSIGIATVSVAYNQDFTALADRYLLVGDPAHMTARLADYAAAGVDTVILQIAATDDADRQRIVNTLAEHLPALHDL